MSVRYSLHRGQQMGWEGNCYLCTEVYSPSGSTLRSQKFPCNFIPYHSSNSPTQRMNKCIPVCQIVNGYAYLRWPTISEPSLSWKVQKEVGTFSARMGGDRLDQGGIIVSGAVDFFGNGMPSHFRPLYRLQQRQKGNPCLHQG